MFAWPGLSPHLYIAEFYSDRSPIAADPSDRMTVTTINHLVTRHS